MSGVELVLAALAAGATAGVAETTTSAIRDLYANLRDRVRGDLARRGQETMDQLEAEEAEPEVWRERLEPHLQVAGVDQDSDTLTTARELLAALGVEATGADSYSVDLRHARGVQVGDHNTQTNSF
jgi:hypothetical protein